MVKIDKIKGKIVENKLNYEKCAEVLGITITAFSNKMNGKSNFTVPEANSLSKYLNLSIDEKLDIFLS